MTKWLGKWASPVPLPKRAITHTDRLGAEEDIVEGEGLITAHLVAAVMDVDVEAMTTMVNLQEGEIFKDRNLTEQIGGDEGVVRSFNLLL